MSTAIERLKAALHRADTVTQADRPPAQRVVPVRAPDLRWLLRRHDRHATTDTDEPRRSA